MAKIPDMTVDVVVRERPAREFTARIVTKHVEAHDTPVLECPESGFTFTRVTTGCIRVQKGDFCAYIQSDDASALARYIWDTARRD